MSSIDVTRRTVIVYTSCKLCLVCCLLFSFLRSERSGIILINLCLAVIGLNITLILVSLSTWSDLRVRCIALACCWHYMMLASLMWMLLEAVNIYQSLVTVFISYDSHFILKRAIIAWGKY